MSTSSDQVPAPAFVRWLRGEKGLAGRLALSWTLAGGLGMEVVLVVAAILGGTSQAPSLPFTATLFFIGGAIGGFAHGALIGVAGRSDDVSLGDAFRGIEAAAFWAVPGLLMAWVLALWISMSAMAVSLARPGMLVMVGLGWVVYAVVCVWGLMEARHGLAHALRRWPERRPGTPLLIAAFAVLMVSFLWVRPEIWFTDLRVSALGAMILAVGATIWIALPVVVFILHFLHQALGDSAFWEGHGARAD